MIIELFGLDNAPRKFEFSLAPEEIELGQENVKLLGEIKTAGELTKRIAQVDVEGEIEAQAGIECTRCLSPVETNLKIPFAVNYIAPEDLSEEKETELSADDMDVSVYEGNSINLSELVREQIILNLPEKIFCREDCKGLCAECGANRNLIDCNCEEKEIDPRWAALKELKRDT